MNDNYKSCDRELKSLYAKRPKMPAFRSIREIMLQRERIVSSCGNRECRAVTEAMRIAGIYIDNIRLRLGITEKEIMPDSRTAEVRMPREVYASSDGQDFQIRIRYPKTINIQTAVNHRNKMNIYLSLPISGRPIEEAREHASRVKALLKNKGHRATTPFDVCDDQNADYADCIGTDISAMLKHDTVCFCLGWSHSWGCNMEREVLKLYNAKCACEGKAQIRIIYENDAAYNEKTEREKA